MTPANPADFLRAKITGQLNCDQCMHKNDPLVMAFCDKQKNDPMPEQRAYNKTWCYEFEFRKPG